MVRTAVVVVHGIGKPAPGATVDALVGALAARNGELRGQVQEEKLSLPDYSLRGSFVRRWFPCHVRNVRQGEHEYCFAEVWWGKRAPGPAGILDTLRLVKEALHLLVGLRVVARTNRTTEAPPRYRALQFLAWLSSFGLVGLVFAMNLLLLLGLGAFVMEQILKHLFELEVGRFLLGAGVLGVIGFSIAQLRAIRSRVGSFKPGTLRSSPFRQELWVSLLFLGGWLATRILTMPQSLPDYGQEMIQGLTWCFTLAVAPLGLTCVWFLVAFAWRDDEWHSRAQASTVTVALQTGFWAALVPTLWVALLAAVPSAWIGTQGEVPEGLMKSALIAQGSHWVIALFALAVLGGYVAWRHWRRPSLRLIVPRIPSIAVLVATTLGAIIFVVVASGLGTESPWLAWIHDFTAWAKSRGIQGYTSIVLGLLVFLLPQIRVVVSLVDDVLSYLEKYTAASGLLPQRPIRSRFRRVVDALCELEKTRGSFDRWVVVAHSQGTVITIDELAASKQSRESIFRKTSAKRVGFYDELAERAEVCLVTAGSPFTHLYQHYFPATYPALDDDLWAGLRGRLSSWTNVYRTDDYVGTHIDFWEADDAVVNHDIGRGGHLDYWSDNRFLKHLEGVLRFDGASFKEPSEPAPKPTPAS